MNHGKNIGNFSKSSSKGTELNFNHEIPKDKLSVLMLEDNENDAELIQMYLKSSNFQTECTLVSNKKDYIDALNHHEHDVILSDHNLPQFNSLEALRIRNQLKFHIPFILVSGAIPEEYAVTILKEGANDYILKDRPQRLGIAITEAIKKQKIINDKLLAEQELLKINERLRLVGKATADAIWDWNIITNEVIWGEGYETLFGYKVSDLTTDISSWTRNIHPNDVKRVHEGIMKMIDHQSKTHWMDEYQYTKADGTFAIVVDKGLVLRDETGKAYRMVGAMQDITKIKELEKKIAEDKLNQQKKNTEIAIQAQEEVREDIAKELHDNINQLMAFSKMMLDTARTSPDIRDMCIQKSYEGINSAIEEVRKLTHAIVAPDFSKSCTFADAIKNLVSDILLINNVNIEMNIFKGSEYNIRDKNLNITFYRIIQEQFNNILKYAKATQIIVELKIVKNEYELVITDNGVGFDCKKINKGIGLRNIASRTDLYGGRMKIISAPGEGCTLKVHIPLENF